MPTNDRVPLFAEIPTQDFLALCKVFAEKAEKETETEAIILTETISVFLPRSKT